MARSVVSRCVKTAVAAATRSHATGASISKLSSRRALQQLSLQPQSSVRMCSSSSRFLSLAEDDGGEGKRRRRGDDSDGEEGEGDDDAEASGELLAEGEEGVEKDGDLEGDEEEDMYKFCVPETDERDEEIMKLYMSDPETWTPLLLARKFYISKQLVEATIFLMAEEAGFTPQEFTAKIEEIKATVAQAKLEQAEKMASAASRGDEQEVTRLQKRDRQDQREADEADDEELTEEEELALHGIDDDFYRNPDFFFLSDAFEGLPPLTRRTGKHKSTDKMYPEEAVELQRLAANNKLTPLPSFAKPTSVQSRWKFAVKDISKNKLPLLVRDQDQTLRMATKEEVLPRSWVRRPPFFQGLHKEI